MNHLLQACIFRPHQRDSLLTKDESVWPFLVKLKLAATLWKTSSSQMHIWFYEEKKRDLSILKSIGYQWNKEIHMCHCRWCECTFEVTNSKIGKTKLTSGHKNINSPKIPCANGAFTLSISSTARSGYLNVYHVKPKKRTIPGQVLKFVKLMRSSPKTFISCIKS